MCHYSPVEVKRQLYRTCFLLLPIHGFWGWNLNFQVNTFTCESSHWPGFPCLSLLSPPLSFPPFSLFFPLLPSPFLFPFPLLFASPFFFPSLPLSLPFSYSFLSSSPCLLAVTVWSSEPRALHMNALYAEPIPSLSFLFLANSLSPV